MPKGRDQFFAAHAEQCAYNLSRFQVSPDTKTRKTRLGGGLGKLIFFLAFYPLHVRFIRGTPIKKNGGTHRKF